MLRLARPTPPPVASTLRLLVGGALLLAAPLGAQTLPAGPPSTLGQSSPSYFPPAGHGWEARAPEAVGMDPQALAAAVAFALANEASSPRDLLENHALTFGREPMGEAIGPFRDRGGPAGIVLRQGYIVAEWGETDRVEPTFSVTKSFLSATVGLAFDRGLIPDLHEPVGRSWAPVVALRGPPSGGGDPEAGPLDPRTAFNTFEVLLPFESEHNAQITWDHLLRQTSDWEGTLWGKPDWVDRPRGELEGWRTRARFSPGTNYMYNDVRVNLLALATLNRWRTPLPEVLKAHLMDPIGASDRWRWFGYDNSWIILDGRMVQSVSGGAHWGGGMWIDVRDMARFGLLTLNRGVWDGERILSEEWVRMSLSPTAVQPGYGFMNWYLNPSQTAVGGPGRDRALEETPPFYHSGAGPNIIYVDPALDLVVVTRWVPNWAGVVARVVASIQE